jgi:hypothetical protein
MSKHSLISTGLGLGLMAASMGASAQLHTFDYSSVYYGSASGGGRYVAFLPTATRGDSSSSFGANGVLMLDMFQPLSGSGSTWAFALGGPVGLEAGWGSDSTLGTAISQNVSWSAGNGLSNNQIFYFPNNEAISMAFNLPVTISSQACNVTFAAAIGTNDQLAFESVEAQPSSLANWASATAAVSVMSGSLTAPVATMAQSAWNAGSVSMSAYAGTALTVAGLATSVGGSVVAAMLAGRNKCVPAYASRATGGGSIITGGSVGMIRIW